MERIPAFQEFWPFYVRQHSKAWTRRFHFAGTLGGLALVVAAVAGNRPYLLIWAPVVAYGLAWISHYFIENNRPATFTYPWWSLRGDFKMFGLMLTGKMNAEVRRFLAA